MPGERSTRPVRRILAVLAAGILLLAMSACNTSSGNSTTPPAATTVTAPSSPLPGAGAAATTATLTTCEHTTVSAPVRYTLACADGGIWLDALHWSAWGSPTAHANGTVWENDCTPNCADGHFVPYPATVTVSDLAGERYSRLQVSAPQAPSGPLDYTIGPDGPR